METKLEGRSKPILSPTRSLDEGFESDPDRISTDSETLSSPSPSFDLLQRTDRDGVTHTQISRRHNLSSASSTNSNSSTSSSLDFSNGPASIICLPGEIESDIDSKVSIPRASQKSQQTQQSTNSREYRRTKTKAPQPPQHQSHHSIPRSHSVDTIRREKDHLTSVDINIGGGRGGDILAGKFVRVTVDPRNQRLMAHSNSMYALYPPGVTSSERTAMHLYPPQYGLTMKPNKNNQIPIGWTQSIPRQTRR